VTPKRPDEGRTSGKHAIGTPNSAQSSLDHANVLMSKSIVRLAFDGSVTCTAPAVRFQRSHASMVPTARSSSAGTPPSFRSHSILEAEKYGSSTRPVVERMRGR
jgi:hypothetical protein